MLLMMRMLMTETVLRMMMVLVMSTSTVVSSRINHEACAPPRRTNIGLAMAAAHLSGGFTLNAGRAGGPRAGDDPVHYVWLLVLGPCAGDDPARGLPFAGTHFPT